ncbi:hypothetical protein ACWWUY_14820, partial [Corynebacterium striatum]
DADAEQGTASEWIEYANDAFEENPNAPHVDVEVEAVNRGILARKVKKIQRRPCHHRRPTQQSQHV